MADADAPARGGRRWTQGERITIVMGLLLVGDLLLLPWHHFAIDVSAAKSLGVTLPSFSYDRNGAQAPHAYFGIAALILAAGMVIQIVATKVSAAVPRLSQIHLIAGSAILGLLLAKLLSNDQFLGAGAYVGVLLGAGLAFGGFLLSQEADAAAGPAVSRSR